MQIEKEVDLLGRVVIPIELRRKFGIEVKDRVLFSLKDDTIRILPLKTCCALCEKRMKIRTN